MFADLELIGIPHRVTIGDRGLKDGKVEYQRRRDTAATTVPVDAIAAFLPRLAAIARPPAHRRATPIRRHGTR